MGTFQIGKYMTLPDWLGPLRIGKNLTLSDWQKWDPSGLEKKRSFQIGKYMILPYCLGPLQIGKNRTLSDWQNWDPSGCKVRAILCKTYKLGRVRFEIRPLRIEVKLLILFTSTGRGLLKSLFST